MFVACSIMQYHKGNELLGNDRYIKVHLLQDLLFIANNLLLEAGKNVSNWVPSTQVIISRELHLKCNIIYCVERLLARITASVYYIMYFTVCQNL